MRSSSVPDSVDAASRIVKDATPLDAAINADYLRGDHFRGGREWIGPEPPLDQYSVAMAKLARVWCPLPVIEEMSEGHSTGAVGREPAFELVLREPPSEGQEQSEAQSAAEEECARLNSLLGNWFDARGGHELLLRWVTLLRSGSRAVLRLVVPPALMSEGEAGFEVEASTPEEALDALFLDVPETASATVATSPLSRRECGVFLYEHIEDTHGPHSAHGTGGRSDRSQRAEVVFVADGREESAVREGVLPKGQTVIRVLEGDKVLHEVPFPCGGLSLMFEGRAPLLLTDPIRRAQRALNMINTMLPLNAAYAGFRSKEYFNVTDVEVEPGADTSEDEAEVVSGPAQTMFWYARPYKDAEGNVKYFPPELRVTEPINTLSLRADIKHFDHAIRRGCRQLHTADSPEAEVSAVARIQMRAVFANDLRRTTPVVEAALRWLQMAVYCLALYLCGQESQIAAFVETYRATAHAKPWTGPLTPDEIRVLIELYSARLLSGEDAAILFGVEDVDAHIAKLKREQGQNLDLQMQRATLFNLWSQSLDWRAALELAGMDEEQKAIVEAALAEGDKADG